VIAKLPFAFGRDAAAEGHKPPPNTVQLDWIPPATADLFERAFARRPKHRPTGAEWTTALAAFESELATCGTSSMHRYVPSRGGCPWCALERRGLFLFITGGAAVPGAVYLDADAVQRQLDEIPSLTKPPIPRAPLDVPIDGEPLAPRTRVYRRAWLLSTAATLVGALVATEEVLRDPHIIEALWGGVSALAFLARPRIASIKRERRERLREAERAYADALMQWHAVATMSDLELRKRDLDQKLEQYRALPSKYTAERMRLEAEKPLHQMRAYLDRFLIADAKIAGIGKKKRATLLSYGIETALDARERLASSYIPKFGETSRGLVFAWVRWLELARAPLHVRSVEAARRAARQRARDARKPRALGSRARAPRRPAGPEVAGRAAHRPP
jgi:DNA-binding helix-hairpin-helix protein with protein kinase domain